MQDLHKQQRRPDNSLAKMSKEEFQILANKYFGNERIRIEPFYYMNKNVNGSIMKKEGVLYYVQSLSARGQIYDVNGIPEISDLKVGVNVSGENYFLSDSTYYLLINDFVCDEITIQEMPWSGGGVNSDNNSIYAVGWTATLY